MKVFYVEVAVCFHAFLVLFGGFVDADGEKACFFGGFQGEGSVFDDGTFVRGCSEFSGSEVIDGGVYLAITKALLQQYNPTKAILISALLFGVFHINPAQILPAFLIGILLAWTYYKTGSLIPCILMHILNNSLSVCLSIKYPEAENMDDLISGTPYLVILSGALLLLIGSILTMRYLTSPKQE